MDIVDKELETAARDASKSRYDSGLERRPSQEEIERIASASTTSSSSSEASVVRREIGMSRLSTQRDADRHPTALSRIQTARSQHSATVGRGSKSRESTKPLPPFGAGRPFPPPLPEREEYVVEFDGPDDPLHPLNWPMRKKCVSLPNSCAQSMLMAFPESLQRPCLDTRRLWPLLAPAFSLRPSGPWLWSLMSQ